MSFAEIVFRRCSVHLVHDLKSFDEGADLNDALLDFFARLGQALVPAGGLDLRRPPVAFLGSLFFGVLCKGGATDGRSGHANVANWARRRLGAGGLFGEDIGGLAVAINETLKDEQGEETGKHWWLALLLNLGPLSLDGEASNRVFCLDSYARCETAFDPPPCAAKSGAALDSYPVEVSNLARAGCHVLLRFRARGDGSSGHLPSAEDSVLKVSDKIFPDPEVVLDGEPSPANGTQQCHEGYMHFELDSTSPTSGELVLEYGGEGACRPPLKLVAKRRMSVFQRYVASFLRGYLQQEWVTSCGNGSGCGSAGNQAEEQPRPSEAVVLPDVPQQETANYCGFFLLEQLFLVLQLPVATLRLLARASARELGKLPWPSQEAIEIRKQKLRAGLGTLFAAANATGTADVEALLRGDQSLLDDVRTAFVDESSRPFIAAVQEWAALQPSAEPAAAADAKRRRLQSQGQQQAAASS